MMKSPEDPRVFLAIVKHGSLAAAARALDVTPSAVTQRLQALEAGLGVRLLDRGTRKMRLTDEGELFHAEAARIAREYEALVDTLQTRRSLVRGHLRLHGPLGFGRRYLAPLVARFHAQHPQVEIALTLSDRSVDPDSAAFDAVVHIGALPDSSKVGYRIAPNERWLCAAPAYLRKAPPLARPEDLAQHACLVLRENDEDVSLWRFKSRQAERAVRVHPLLTSNDGEVIKQWALLGQGVMLRSEWDVAAEVTAGKLLRLLPQWRQGAADVMALVPQRKGMSARVKAFLDFLAAEFRPQPPWRRQS
jgi:DNA-binding transcriptional LysR family regulator